MYRLFGRDSKNLQQLKNVSKAYFNRLFLQEKTVTMNTLFNMKQFSRNNILLIFFWKERLIVVIPLSILRA
jgi:hypothetical protein